MPIPTDTFWNIKRLNWIFALSAAALFGATTWSILQDHAKSWRKPQQASRVWDSAFTTDRLQADLSDSQRAAQLAAIDKEKQLADEKLKPRRADIDRLNKEIKELESERATREFSLNNQKSTLGVLESALQDAQAANDAARVKQLTESLQAPRRVVAEANEYLSNQIVAVLSQKKSELRDATAEVDSLQKQSAKLTADQQAMSAKLVSLDPKRRGGIIGLIGSINDKVRNAPLLDFINPSEKVQQLVLPDVQTDVAFMKIPTIDRCTTCHVNIAKKEFSASRVIAYLEKEATIARRYQIPASTKANGAAAVADRPGAVAMPEFWHAWALKIAPDVIRRNAGRLNTITATVGKSIAISYDGQPLLSFKYNPALNDAKTPPSTQPAAGAAINATEQNAILIELLNALFKLDTVENGRIKVTIAAADLKALDGPRDVAMRYVEELRKGVTSALPHDQQRLLEDRYRFSLADAVNAARRKQGLAALDASAALLAHPRLDLYVDPDSKHPMESGENTIGMGCTSCHDGSGQETDFVLAAHTPRPIYVDSRTGAPIPEAILPAGAITPEDERSNLASMLAVIAPEDSLTPKGVSSLYINLENSGHATAQSSTAHDAEQSPINYIDPATGRSGKAVTQMAYWKATYEPEAPRNFELVYHEWDWPMRPPRYLQANCVRCHANVLDIKDEAPDVFQGRELFAQLGCVNCHQMDSLPAEDVPTDAKALDPRLAISNGRVKVGPSLTHVTAKLSPAFINTWIWAPKAFRPTTKMPHFFMLENNSSDEEIRRTRQEARAMTEYLVVTSDPLLPAYKIDPALKGSADGGKAIFNSIGCQACHANLNDPQPETRNGKAITLAEKWIVTDLIRSGKLKREMAQANGGKDPDDKSLRAAAEKLFDEMTYNERQTFAKEHFEQEPGQLQSQIERYSDGSAKPVFVHVGPELSGVGTKLLADRSADAARQWLFDWLKEPRHYSSYTFMPRLRLNDPQAIDLAEYLLAQKRTTANPDDPWSAGLAQVDTEKQIELTALFLRSQYSAQTALAKADDDAMLTQLAADALKRTTNKSVEAERAALAEAKAKIASLNKDQKRMIWLGKKLISHYGCMSCHAINGTEELTAPCTNLSDWGQKGVDKLDFGYIDPHKIESLPPARPIMLVNGVSAEASKLAFAPIDFGHQQIAKPVSASWPQLHHARTSWLLQKLKNTRVFDRGRSLLEPDRASNDDLLKSGKPYEKLKMPTFYLKDEQVHQIATFMISNRDRLISDKLAGRAGNERARLIARGRELTHKFNCVSCHVIERNQPQVQQWYKQDEIVTRAPPSLRGEGNKIQYAWLFNFFKNVENLRPLLYQHNGIRMPSFPATDDEWTAIIAYFNTVSNKESADLKQQLDMVNRYVSAERAKVKPLPAPDQVWPGDDWYTRSEFVLAKDRLRDWALATGNTKPIEFDESKNTPAQLGKAYRASLYKARFTIDLYNAPYPFVESGQAEISDDRMKLGEEFMNQMQCLSCHYLGDPNVAGAVKEPKAPNLSLSHRRLQRKWIRHWLQEPPVIQTGTSMPAFFSGLATFNLSGLTWSETAGRPKEEIEFYNNRYGRTADEQAKLLLDYLYEAGVRGITTVQASQNMLPKPPAPPKPASTVPTLPTSQPAVKPNAKPAPASAPTTKPVSAVFPCHLDILMEFDRFLIPYAGSDALQTLKFVAGDLTDRPDC